MAGARCAAESPRESLAGAVAMVAMARYGNHSRSRASGNRDAAGRRGATVFPDILAHGGAANGGAAGQVRLARGLSTRQATRTKDYREDK